MLLSIQQAERARHQHAVDPGVDLGEIGRFEWHGNAEIGQRVGQLGPALVQQLHRFGPFGLQPPLHAGMLCGKFAQAGFVAIAQRLQMAQHQRRHVVAAGQFNLRQGFNRLHRRNQRTQRQQQAAHVRRQHRAGLHVGHIAAFALMKTDQDGTLFVHMAHRQPRAVAVAPGRAFNGAKNVVGLDLAQVPQVVFQRPLFHRDLRAHVQVLHLATPAGTRVQAKVGATGLDALG